MLLEAKGSWAEAEKAYSSLLEDNPVDQVNSLTILHEMMYYGVKMVLIVIHICMWET